MITPSVKCATLGKLFTQYTHTCLCHPPSSRPIPGSNSQSAVMLGSWAWRTNGSLPPGL